VIRVGLGIAALVGIGCGGGGGPRCGDGVHQPELGEQCDDGNDIDDDACHNDCTANLPPQFTIQWGFNEGEADGFTGDSCVDLGIAQVQVDLSGPATATQTGSCSLRQVVFADLPAGTYLITVDPQDINGNSKVTAPVEETVALSNGSMTKVVIPFDAWAGSYTGTFFFRLQWGGQDCSTAAPPVAKHVLTLEVGGSAVTQRTDADDPLDGSGSGACRPFADEFPQSALAVPWGPATFTVEGLDSGDTPQFRQTFDTFVGAGISNPELHFDVASLAPDAGVPDATTSD